MRNGGEALPDVTRNDAYRAWGRLPVFWVADHSKSAHYAGGLSVEEIAEQQAEASALNRCIKAREP
jgi:DNA polymerase (family 10)